MAVQKIITESDNRLRAPNSKVILIDEEVKKEILDLKDTLASAKNPEGAGLAAPQIGINKKICVVRNYTEDVADPSKVVFQEFVFINPKITSASKETNLVSFSDLFLISSLSPVFLEITTRYGIPIKSLSANLAPADTPALSSNNTSTPSA